MSGDPSFFEDMHREVPGGQFKSQAEKNESYSERIVRAILKAGDMDDFRIRVMSGEAGRSGWTHYLNHKTSFPWATEACRLFNFTLLDLFKKSKIAKHPLILQWNEHADNYPDTPLLLVFRCVTLGDLVLLSRDRSVRSVAGVSVSLEWPDMSMPATLILFSEFLRCMDFQFN